MTDSVMCQFWEGPMHGQWRTINAVDVRQNGNIVEVVECPAGPVTATATPSPLVVHVYYWSGSTLIYHGVK